MARPSPAPPALRRTAVAALVAAGALALPAAAAAAAPVPAPTAGARVAGQPAPCTPQQSEFATASTASPLAVTDLGAGDYTIRAKGSVGGYTTRGIESVTVFLDGDYVGRATLSKAQKFSFTVVAKPRTWSLDVPATAGAHDLLVCSNSSYSSLAGVSTVVQVPALVFTAAASAARGVAPTSLPSDPTSPLLPVFEAPPVTEPGAGASPVATAEPEPDSPVPVD